MMLPRGTCHGVGTDTPVPLQKVGDTRCSPPSSSDGEAWKCARCLMGRCAMCIRTFSPLPAALLTSSHRLWFCQVENMIDWYANDDADIDHGDAPSLSSRTEDTCHGRSGRITLASTDGCYTPRRWIDEGGVVIGCHQQLWRQQR